MITLSSAMLVTLGFLLAALLVVLVLPAYRRRIERFASDSVRRSLPLTEEEIRADKDRLRAEFAMAVHKLEGQIEDGALAAARQSVEVNRRDARIHDLAQALETQELRVAEHENARRVLEQAILDRLPKVEQRLAESRKLLAQRDADISVLSETSAKQTDALEEATQINVQQSEELYRVRAALDTRAARNRDSVGDPRFDTEVALRTEIEMLRAKGRDQSALISRLQEQASENEGRMALEPELERVQEELAKADAELMRYRSSEDSVEARREAQAARILELESEQRDRSTEIAKLKGALQAYESNQESGATAQTLAARAEIGALNAEIEEQRRTIQSLRSDLASSNERLARQAQHFRDELRRLSAGGPAQEQARRVEASPPRLTLAERLAAPRAPQTAANAGADSSPRETRIGAVLKAINGGAEASGVDDGADAASGERHSDKAAAEVSPRRPRLLERISAVDKPGS